MEPDLELVNIRQGESFVAWCHGYPFRTVRWHYHPEFEIHLIVATTGKFYIGDYIGNFGPGQLIMTGPNLPQNWISDVGPGETVPLRNYVIQFGEKFISTAIEAIAELSAIKPLLERSRRGLLFDDMTGFAVRPLMEELVSARGIRRLELFSGVLDRLSRAPEPQVLASVSFELDAGAMDNCGVNRAIAYLRENLTEPLTERDLAAITGQSTSAFSRSFRRHTGTTLIRYMNQLRIDLACQMLLTDPDVRVTDICYEVGFSNLSNFNRHFLKLKGVSPSRFRACFAENRLVEMAG